MMRTAIPCRRLSLLVAYASILALAGDVARAQAPTGTVDFTVPAEFTPGGGTSVNVAVASSLTAAPGSGVSNAKLRVTMPRGALMLSATGPSGVTAGCDNANYTSTGAVCTFNLARLPDRCGALVRACEGCHDAALAYGAPFVSGKDSLNNEWTAPDGSRRAIPPTLVVTALGLVPDATKRVTSDFKAAGDAIFVVGPTVDAECARPDDAAPARYVALHAAMCAELVTACHDAGEGGLAVAVAEMAIGGRCEFDVDLAPLGAFRPGRAAFTEDPARLVGTVAAANAAAFAAALSGHPCVRVGVVTAGDTLRLGGAEVGLDAAVAAFKSDVA